MKMIKISILWLLIASCAGANGISTLSLKLTVLTPSVKTGRGIKIRVATVNDSDHAITYRNTSIYCNYSDRVLTSDGIPVPETDFKKQLGCGSGDLIITGRNITVTLKPGESSNEEIVLTEFVNLSQPGQYSVQVDRTFPDIGKISSNVVTVDVTP